jgi:hypothetical protein
MNSVGRRAFLRASAAVSALGAALFGPALNGAVSGSRSAAGWIAPRSAHAAELPSSRTAQRLLELVQDRPDARLLGKAYVWSYAGARRRPPTSVELVNGILPRALRTRSVVEDRRELRRAVRARMEEDFSRARVVSVAGWMLSETEARLCALAWLEEENVAPE